MTALIALQSKIGVTADGSFGPGTLKAAATYFNLSKERAAHFFGQCSHETGGFKVFSENLNYSQDGLVKIFKKYFPNVASTQGYARTPEKIANKVYANRMGNGNEASGDGWKFRGRGCIQTTGHDNYLDFSKFIGRADVMTTPDIVATELAFESAICFFTKNNLWATCDKGVNDHTITELTKRINGGFNGLDERISNTNKFYSML